MQQRVPPMPLPPSASDGATPPLDSDGATQTRMADPWIAAVSDVCYRYGAAGSAGADCVPIDQESSILEQCVEKLAAPRGWTPRTHAMTPSEIGRLLVDNTAVPFLLHTRCDIGPRCQGWIALGVGGFAFPDGHVGVPVFVQGIDAHVSLGTVQNCSAECMDALRNRLRTLVEKGLDIDPTATKMSAWRSWYVSGRLEHSGSRGYVILRLRHAQMHGFMRAIRFLQSQLSDVATTMSFTFESHQSPHISIKRSWD